MSDIRTKDFAQEHKNTTLFSSIDEDSFSMSIDPQSMNHIISRLTDLYSDPIVATVREIMSNAIDATIMIPEADRLPIDVVLPTELAPELIITDHALGLSLDEIKNIYTRYGSSTKRQDMTQIGAYGLGSKAPLSYTSSFKVDSVKDGMYTSILISAEQDSNKVKIIEHKEVDEHNSMSVSIPVKREDISKFHKAFNTYVAHPVKGVVINGLEDVAFKPSPFVHFGTLDYAGIPLELTIKTLSVKETVELIVNILSGTFTFELTGVLSGYAYPLTEEHYAGLKMGVELVPGIVDFSSSRDEITNNNRKSKLIQAVQEFIEDKTLGIRLLVDSLGELTDKDKYEAYRYLIQRDYRGVGANDLTDDVQEKLFKLSTGVSVQDTSVRLLGAVDKYNDTVLTIDSNFGNIASMNLQLSYYFNADKYNNDMLESMPALSRQDYVPLTAEEVKNTVSFPVGEVFKRVASPENHLKVVTGVDSLKNARKIMRERKYFFKNSADVLIMAVDDLSTVKKKLDPYYSPLYVDYYTIDDFTKAVNQQKREEGVKAKSPKSSEAVLRRFAVTSSKDLMRTMLNNVYFSTSDYPLNDEYPTLGVLGQFEIKTLFKYSEVIEECGGLNIIKFSTSDLRYSDKDYLDSLDYLEGYNSYLSEIKSSKLYTFLKNKLVSQDYPKVDDFTTPALRESKLTNALIVYNLVVDAIKSGKIKVPSSSALNKKTVQALIDCYVPAICDFLSPLSELVGEFAISDAESYLRCHRTFKAPEPSIYFKNSIDVFLRYLDLSKVYDIDDLKDTLRFDENVHKKILKDYMKQLLSAPENEVNDEN